MEKKLHNFNKKCKLHLACSKKDLYRPIMNHIYFDKGSAIATNGHILAMLNIKECSDFTDEEIEKLDGKLIHGKKIEVKIWNITTDKVKYLTINVNK